MPFEKGNRLALKPIESRLDNWMPEPNTGCYLWLGQLKPDGYPHQISINGKRLRVSRAVYERERGPIPEGLVIDHICGVRSCVNPTHLRAVTQRVNVISGNLPAISRSRIDYSAPCPHGRDHRVIWYVKGNGHRQKLCLTCSKGRGRRKYAK